MGPLIVNAEDRTPVRPEIHELAPLAGIGVVRRFALSHRVRRERAAVARIEHEHLVVQLARHVERTAVRRDTQAVGVIAHRLPQAAFPQHLFGDQIKRDDVRLIRVGEIEAAGRGVRGDAAAPAVQQIAAVQPRGDRMVQCVPAVHIEHIDSVLCVIGNVEAAFEPVRRVAADSQRPDGEASRRQQRGCAAINEPGIRHGIVSSM
jgi:hypothetical protein